MKILTIIISIIFAINTIAQENNSKINISYNLNINDIFHVYNHRTPQSHIQISFSQKQKLFSAFINHIKKKQVVTTYNLPNNANELTFSTANSKEYLLNGEYVLDVPEGKITTKNGTIYLNNKKLISFNSDNFIDELSSIEFFETWNFNPNTGSFIKTVKQMGLYTDTNKTKLFSFKTNEYKKNVYNLSDNINYSLSSNNILLGKVSYYVNLGNNSKIRNSPNPENSNYYNYIQANKRYKFLTNILEYIKNETVENKNNIVYDNGKLLNYNEIINKFERVDTVEIENPETGEYELMLSITENDLQELSRIKFIETWYLDIEKFAIKKVVHSIDLIKKYINYEYESEVAYKNLFQIQLKNLIKKKISPFFNKPIRILCENSYAADSFIYKTNGKKLLPDTFAFVDNKFTNNLLQVGKVTSMDTIEEEDYETGEYIQRALPVTTYGVINNKGEKLVPCFYPEILYSNNGISLLSRKNNNDYGEMLFDTLHISTEQLTKLTKIKNKPLLNKTFRLLSNNIYTTNNIIYKIDGTKLLPDTFAYVDKSFSYNLLKVGVVTGMDTIEEEDYETGEIINTTVPVISYGLINNKGKIFLPCKYKNIDILQNNVYLISKDTIAGKYEKERYTEYSIINNQAKDIYPNKFASVKYISKNSAKIKIYKDSISDFGPIESKYGIIDLQGNYLIPIIYDNIIIKNKKYIVTQKDNKYGLFKKDGKQLTKNIYDEIVINNIIADNELIKVRKNDKYGLINNKGEEIVECKYIYISSFNKEKAFVFNKERYFSINNIGEYIKDETLPIEKKYTNGYKKTKIVYKTEKLYYAEYGEYKNKEFAYYGLIDSLNNTIIPCIYNELDSFSANLYRVKNDSVYFLLNKLNKQVGVKYSYIGEFKNGSAIVFNGKKMNIYYEEDGEVYEDYDIDYRQDYNENNSSKFFRDIEYGFININGERISSDIYKDFEIIGNSLYIVSKNGLFGIINNKNEIIQDFIYKKIDFSNRNNVFRFMLIDKITKKEKWGLFNNKGSILINAKYDYISSFDWGYNYTTVTLNNKYGVINNKGEFVSKLLFD